MQAAFSGIEKRLDELRDRFAKKIPEADKLPARFWHFF